MPSGRVLTVSIESTPRGVVLLCEGQLDVATHPLLDQAVDRVLTIEGPPPALTVDLRSVQAMDAQGIRAVAMAAARCRELSVTYAALLGRAARIALAAAPDEHRDLVGVDIDPVDS